MRLDGAAPVRIQLFHVPDCPLVDRVRATLRSSLAKASAPVVVEEIEGSYPSPTLLIDGIDVTGRSLEPDASCRLDLPTEEQILTALSGWTDAQPATLPADQRLEPSDG